MELQVLSEDEIDMVSGAGSGGFIRGCINGGMAGLGAAPSGYGAQGAGAGCLAGGSIGMLGGGAEAQALAGYFAGLGFGPYGGSSSDPLAANYENSFDRQNSLRRMASI